MLTLASHAKKRAIVAKHIDAHAHAHTCSRREMATISANYGGNGRDGTSKSTGRCAPLTRGLCFQRVGRGRLREAGMEDGCERRVERAVVCQDRRVLRVARCIRQHLAVHSHHGVRGGAHVGEETSRHRSQDGRPQRWGVGHSAK